MNIRKKTPDELSQQLDAADLDLGAQLEPPFEKRELILKKSADELATYFPVRYDLYTELLRDGRHMDPERRAEIQSVLRSLNNLDFYIANHQTGNEQDRVLFARQFNVFEDLRDFFEDGKRRGYVKLPTGVGKTVLFLELTRVLRQKTLIVVPTTTLVEQTLGSIQKFASDLDMGRIDRIDKKTGEDVTVITYQSLVLGVKNGTLNPEQFELVILDEAHRALGEETLEVLSGKHFAHATMLGFTATPKFTEEKQVKTLLLPEEVHSMNIQEAVEEGLLAGFHVILARTHVDLRKIKVSSGGEYDEKELDKAINTAARNRAAVDLYKKAFKGEKFVAYCNSVAHAKRVAEEFVEQGFPVAAIYGEQNPTEQEAILEKLRTGELIGVTNAKILVEGWDNPSVKVCLNLRPTQSLVDAEQRGGRVLRLFNNRRATVVDFIDDADIERFPITFVEVANASAIPPDRATSSKRSKGDEPSAPSINWNEIKIEGLDLLADSEQVLVFVKERTEEKYQLAPSGWFTLGELAVLGNRRVQAVRGWINSVTSQRREVMVKRDDVLRKYRNPQTRELEWYVEPDIAEAALKYGKEIERDYTRTYETPPENWVELLALERELGRDAMSVYRQFKNKFPDDVSSFKVGFKRTLKFISPEFAAHIRKVVRGEEKTIVQIRKEEADSKHEDYLNALKNVMARVFGTNDETNSVAYRKIVQELGKSQIKNIKIVSADLIIIESKEKDVLVRKGTARQLNKARYQEALTAAGPGARINLGDFMEQQTVLSVQRG